VTVSVECLVIRLALGTLWALDLVDHDDLGSLRISFFFCRRPSGVGVSTLVAVAGPLLLFPVQRSAGHGHCVHRPARAARPWAAPSLREEPARLTLSNEHVEIDIARVGRCAVRVRRAEDHADTLLTFDLPDELVPCEARVVPDLLHADGVALRIEATAPRWTQTMTVALAAGDDAPTVTIARATRDGDDVAHALVNAGDEPVTFTVAGRDVTVAPGGVARLPRG
jgi:hypothetical protein